LCSSIFSTPKTIVGPVDIPEDIIDRDKKELFDMHDVIVDATINSFSNDTGSPYVTMAVHEYFKNPQNRSQLLVSGEFGLTGDFCAIPNNCHRILAYLYQDDNGNLSSGDTWVWTTAKCNPRCILESGE
jgi:hypothetical protein